MLTSADNRGSDETTVKILNAERTLVERMSPSTLRPIAGHHHPSGTRLTSRSIPGRSTSSSHLSLSQRISSAPVPLSKITPQTLNMRSGPSNLQVPFHPSRDWSGSMSLQERRSTLMSSSQDSSPLLLRIQLPHPSETLISPSGKVNPPNSFSLMATGPLPGTLLLPPSSVCSPIKPWNYKFIQNTSFNFSVPFAIHRQRSLTWTRPLDGMLEKSSTSNSPTWPDFSISRPGTSRMTVQETKQAPTKRKSPTDRTDVQMRFAASGTVGHATAALQSAVSVTSAQSTEETTLVRNIYIPSLPRT